MNDITHTEIFQPCLKESPLQVSIDMKSYEVVDTGSVIIINGEYVEFHIDDLRFRFTLMESSNNGTGISAEIKEDENGSTFMNFIFDGIAENSYGGIQRPANIAKINGRTLYLIFATRGLTGVDERHPNMILNYTWLLKKE